MEIHYYELHFQEASLIFKIQRNERGLILTAKHV